VPEDIAIVGCDGLEESRYLDTPLTTVELSATALCDTAMQLLLRRIRENTETSDPPMREPEIVKVPTRLCPGATA
jgi:LacI family transcriptional regulator